MTVFDRVLGSCLLIVGLLSVSSPKFGKFNPFMDPSLNDISSHTLDQCFCQLKGQVDVCCCDVDTVNNLNKNYVLPMVTKLVRVTFFKFFKVNLHRSCPFWADDGSCVLKDCSVQECPEEKLPPYLKAFMVSSAQDMCFDPSDEEVSLLSMVNVTISAEQRQDFSAWHDYDSTEDNFCDVEERTSNVGSYVDLTLNPERYTGYAGHSPSRVWRAIYHENCFRPDIPEDLPSSIPPFHPSLVQGMCLEKRAFYRVVSGLHASINIHLSAKHLLKGGEKPKFGPNAAEFVRRFDARTTEGQGPEWLKNLYFAYLVVLRAVVKAEPFWDQYQFYTGNGEEDKFTRDHVAKLIKGAKTCSSLFDETMMFSNTSSTLKREFKSHFRNISRIMDCVGCDKCKLWGKLQIKGIGTALKILFSEHKTVSLDRMEIVTLFNVLERFSQSIESLSTFKDIVTET